MLSKYRTLVLRCYLPKSHEKWDESSERIIYTDHFDNLEHAVDEIRNFPELKLELVETLDPDNLPVEKDEQSKIKIKELFVHNEHLFRDTDALTEFLNSGIELVSICEYYTNIIETEVGKSITIYYRG